MLWPFTTSAHGASPVWLQLLFSDREGVIHSPACFSMKTTSWTGAIQAKLIIVVRACPRVIYSRAGVGQRLLAWLTSEPACTNSFCPNWSRLPWKRTLWRNCYGRSITHPLKARHLISWLSAFPWMPGAEHRRLVPLLAKPCSVPC